ncbi:cobaltochelatase subunit CobN [Saccharophagus degradans]|uniref:Cobaltochelatase subunit CobN n=1 Tax=Saccharophagus degradans TaxID=86304 RepID=A0AAW7X980_9GAMM|nr:cobaltochelatase subunit CobN [Saccharophagus degradans]MDO6424014.1 cobaltochelatase subunit CobN [Saccharophagus degradans]MDO6609147.1 cobaltochelatase subunit CobN [Saccharophagus degradans]
MKYFRYLLTSACFALVLFCNQAYTQESSRALFVSGSHSSKAKVNLFERYATEQNIVVDYVSARELDDMQQAKAKFEQYDIVLFSSVSRRDSERSFQKYAPIVAEVGTRFIALGWMDNPGLNKQIKEADALWLYNYFDNGGIDNLDRMARFMRQVVFSGEVNTVAEPIIYPDLGIYHFDAEQKVFANLTEYLAWKKPQLSSNKPKVGVLFQRAQIEAGNTELVDRTIAQLEAKGAIAVPFFFSLRPGQGDYADLITQNDETFIDLIISFRSIHWASERKKEFEKWGVPVMQALTYLDGNTQHWEKSSQGISANMSPFQLVLPESAGVVDPWIVAANNRETEQTEIIDYQFDHLINKALKVAALKYTPNSDKKLTVMVWGNRDVGASFLNIPQSLGSITTHLSKAGYDVKPENDTFFSSRIDRILDPFYRSYELDSLLDDDLAELMPLEEYLAWFNLLPAHVAAPINEYWGEAENNFMVVSIKGKKYFVLPRIRVGNMLVMRQPPRADNDEEDKRIYHKGTIPMNHYYLAAYFYARQYWGSHAIVHLGTHGSHEYLPGKERGLSLYDQGNLAAWDTPIVYPFIVDDVGEAMQTKRRGRATVIAHMTPPFAAAGLHGDIADLHELMHQYKSMDTGGVKEKTAKQIKEMCVELNLCADMGWDAAKMDTDFAMFIEELHSYMEDLATQNQPLGLHTFGEHAERRLLVSTLIQMLGREFVELAADIERSDHHDEHDHHHTDHSEGIEGNGRDVVNVYGEGSHVHEGEDSSLALEKLIGFSTIQTYVIEGQSAKALPEALQPFIATAREHYEALTDISELENLERFLAGEFVSVKNGGDPIRNPASIPTGLNLYGFDPARVPTPAAYEQGRELTEQLIADYYAKHGRYPDKLAFSLWSMETMRHYGVLESQVLAAMGMKPVWSPDGRVTGTEIIPAGELKRPRVDVVLSATGLYRDAFPNVMQLLAKAVKAISDLKEENNSIWENSQRIATELKAQGVADDEAEYLSSVRIFSNASGNYGSGLGDAAIASDTWEADAKLADLYLSRMGFYYGEDDSRWGQKAPEGIDLYSKQLSGTDIALFSRSSNVFGLLASDDPFQYFGGLALAVRNIDGVSPEMMISNLRDAKNAKAETAASFLAKELRTRSFHPRWIEEMKKEGYSGAVTMAGNTSNFFGWQVMDPNMVRDDQWQTFFEVYVQDSLNLQLNEWFEEVNPGAQATIIERMLEAARKDYWQANDETLQALIERYQDLVVNHDLVVDNQKLREFLEGLAAGYGVDLNLPAPEVAALAVSQQVDAIPEKQPVEQVQGQKLEQVQNTSDDQPFPSWLLYSTLGMLLIMLAGAYGQSRQSQKALMPAA